MTIHELSFSSAAICGANAVGMVEQKMLHVGVKTMNDECVEYLETD